MTKSSSPGPVAWLWPKLQKRLHQDAKGDQDLGQMFRFMYDWSYEHIYFDFKTLTQIHSDLMTNSLRGYKVQERNYVKEMADKISSTYWKAEIDLVQNVLLLAATIANKLGESDKRIDAMPES